MNPSMTMRKLMKFMQAVKKNTSADSVSIHEFRNKQRTAGMDEFKGNPCIVVKRNEKTRLAVIDDCDLDRDMADVAKEIIDEVKEWDF